MKNHFSFQSFLVAMLSLSVLVALPHHVSAAPTGQVFSTPEQAVAALSQAVSTTNRAALAMLFGPAVQELVNPDETQGATELDAFTDAFTVTNRLVRESDLRMFLEVGLDAWPFPIPLVKQADGWRFDTAAGIEEILNRRIGGNELAVLRVMRAYVAAQREYASRDHDGDDVLEFAQRLLSSPGKTDGLYWPTDLNGEISPLGPLVAYAQSEGYSRDKSASDDELQPFHGYFFKILTRQGKNAPGGKYDYIINGNMIGGFALIAWPAEYDQSGVMTFIVNQQGRIYQRDLGVKTAKVVKNSTTYDLDKNWQVSKD